MFLSYQEHPYGDRCQELVFIGKDLDHQVIQGILDNCLMREDEMKMGLEMIQMNHVPQRSKYPTMAYFFPGKENYESALEEILEDLDIGEIDDVIFEEPEEEVVHSTNMFQNFQRNNS